MTPLPSPRGRLGIPLLSGYLLSSLPRLTRSLLHQRSLEHILQQEGGLATAGLEYVSFRRTRLDKALFPQPAGLGKGRSLLQTTPTVSILPEVLPGSDVRRRQQTLGLPKPLHRRFSLVVL